VLSPLKKSSHLPALRCVHGCLFFLLLLSLAQVRLDMSEFMERHTVSKLIGSPPGEVGQHKFRV